MVPSVYAALKSRRETSGKPGSGWVFPSSFAEGHFNKDTAKYQHAKALAKANEKAGKAITRKLVIPALRSPAHGADPTGAGRVRRLHTGMHRGA